MGQKSLTEKIEEAKELLEKLELEADQCENGKSGLPFEVGQSYFFRTVTYHLLGKVKAVKKGFLVLKDASWVADSGRFNTFINKGTLDTSSEIEPVECEVILNLNSITDAFEWDHKLPRDVK